MKTDTPETDAKASDIIGFFSCATVPADFARKLERERDEALTAFEEETRFHNRTHSELVQVQCKLMDTIRERDEAMEALSGRTVSCAACNHAAIERDEAREDAAHWKTEYLIVAARLCGKKHPRDNGIISEHEIIPKLTQERDEAREKAERYRLEANAMMLQRDEAQKHLQDIKEYGTEEINAAVDLRQKLAAALLERDEARSLVDHYREQKDLLPISWDV